MDYPSALKRSKVPIGLHAGLVNYIEHHRQPGSFLLAVLENNLVGALRRGDDVSRASLQDIVAFLFFDAPAYCWGSKDRVTAWLAARDAEEQRKIDDGPSDDQRANRNGMEGGIPYGPEWRDEANWSRR